MTERPILFSAPMVRGLLDGRKTQTRRAIKLKTGDTFDEKALVGAIQEWRPVFDKIAGIHVGRESVVIRCPYGVPSDVLWVREECWLYGRWQALGGVTTTGRPKRTFGLIGQQARYDNPGYHHTAHYGGNDGWSWRPGIHMPRWASRISLRVTDVRVERLQEISATDAEAEGVREPSLGETVWSGMFGYPRVNCPPRIAYAVLWDEINGPGSWDANPWVWAVSFERVQP